MIPTAVDVLVVGYGPVGAALAGFLGGHGVRTLVIDKAADIYHAPRAIALDNEALRILQWAGVLGDFERVRIPRVEMHSPYVGHFCTLLGSTLIDGHPKLVTFYQPQLDRALRDKAQVSAHVTALKSTQLAGFTEDAEGVSAMLRTADGQAHAVRAKYIVGADGANSQVRASAGLAMEGEAYQEDWLIVDATGVANNIEHVEFICNPKRPVPHMVAPGGRTRWEFMLQPGETRELMESEARVRTLVAPWPGAAGMTIERRAVYRFEAKSANAYRRGCVFLCGDAAHLTPPFAGQGLVSGLRDAANLSWKLAWVVRGQADASILDSYDQERRPHAIAMIALARSMGEMIMPKTALKAILIQGLQKLLRLIPPVRRKLEAWDDKPKNEFPEGLFVRGAGRIKRGAPLPQTVNDGRFSDEALGKGFALVGYGGTPILEGNIAERWRAMGGSVVRLPEYVPVPDAWCAVVRPDRVVMNDGPLADASRLVEESLQILEKRP